MSRIKEKRLAELLEGGEWHRRYTDVRTVGVDHRTKNIKKKPRKPKKGYRALKKKQKRTGPTAWKFHEYTLKQYTMTPTSADSACVQSAKKAGETECTLKEFMEWWETERVLKIKTLGQLRMESKQNKNV